MHEVCGRKQKKQQYKVNGERAKAPQSAFITDWSKICTKYFILRISKALAKENTTTKLDLFSLKNNLFSAKHLAVKQCFLLE